MSTLFIGYIKFFKGWWQNRGNRVGLFLVSTNGMDRHTLNLASSEPKWWLNHLTEKRGGQ